MVTILTPLEGDYAIVGNNLPITLGGLSTDTPPTTRGALLGNNSTLPIPNMSMFIEGDTGLVRFFDGDSETWGQGV